MDDKELLRTGVRSARAARSHAERAKTGRRIAAHAATVLGLVTDPDAPRTVAAYAAVGDEPPTHALLDALGEAGAVVLLPLVTADHRLEWAAYAGWERLRPGPRGLLEPAAEPQDGDALARADLVLVPALAVDTRGNRLGRGGGFYDRALATTRVERRVAVVYADELLADVPAEPHDQRVGWALTPDGLVPLTTEA